MVTQLDQYAVMGNPIAHSRSPRIHHLFAAQHAQALEYRAILVTLGGFAAAARAFQHDGGKGLNVTVPFKPDAWVFADILSARAERAGAVNTLIFQGNSVCGDNTDGIGLVCDLTINHGYALGGRRILLLGAGGAARGILQPLLAASPAHITIANRSVEKAAALALRFGDLGAITACALDALAGRHFDLIINATSAGLADSAPAIPPGILAKDAWCYDLLYGRVPSAFLRWGQEQGAAHCVDGLGMLVEQAAESFQLWRGIRPDSAAVIATIRQELSASP